MSKTLYLDTETTGLDPKTTRIVEIAIVDDDGRTLLNTLLDPGIPIPPEASAIHGITDAQVVGMPRIWELLPCILGLARGRELVIYNKAYDTQFIPFIHEHAGSIRCCMLEAMRPMGVHRWPRLIHAAEWAGYAWEGKAHSALGDALACRHVWQKLTRVAALA